MFRGAILPAAASWNRAVRPALALGIAVSCPACAGPGRRGSRAARPDAIILDLEDSVRVGPCARAVRRVFGRWVLVERVRDVPAVERLVARGAPEAVVIDYGDLCAELELALGTEHPELSGVRTLVLAAGSSRTWLLDGVVIGAPETAERPAPARRPRVPRADPVRPAARRRLPSRVRRQERKLTDHSSYRTVFGDSRNEERGP